MKAKHPATTRRTFLSHTAAGATIALTLPTTIRAASQNEPKRKPPLDRDLVRQLVRAAHSQIETVKQLLATQPRLVNASWDWGNGDFETALGAASHMGRADIADILLAAGARRDLFHYAMTGNLEVIQPAVVADQSIVTVKGPHGITLMFHAAISGQVPLVTFLKKHGATITDNCLNASVRYGRSYPMTAWLLDNGAGYHGQKGFGKRPLAEWARAEGLVDIADLLDQADERTSRSRHP